MLWFCRRTGIGYGNRKASGRISLLPPIQFEFRELREEIDAISALARDFVTPGSDRVFGEMKASLATIQSSRGSRVVPWMISEEFPLRTIASEGEYERGKRGRYSVFAELTSVWEIRPIKPPKKAMLPKGFALDGKASTRIRLIQKDDERELAMWRLEIGDDASPGCHFHTQVLGQTEAVPFPKALSVPRLPFFLATPTVALEYVLGELFQDRWEREGLREGDELQVWRRIQSKRLGRLLAWQSQELTKPSGLGSPWIRLKKLKPEAALFL